MISTHLSGHWFAVFLGAFLFLGDAIWAQEEKFTTSFPQELTNAVLHNPGMGWVLYENYPLDQHPNGSSTLVTLPKENFEGVDVVALMFSWQDIEQAPDQYDFSKVDFAYDFWASRGKEIQLRLSATTLMWWAQRNPPAGKGAPDYVLAKMAPHEKQIRHLEGTPYTVEDPRNPYYRERLTKFLQAVGKHFSGQRPVTLIDLRGFGVWGEWHSGFQFRNEQKRRKALKGVIDLWSKALPNHLLSLSYSYDPDGPKELYGGPREKFDPQFTNNYAAFIRYSAFDYALKKKNITFRRDGCGGAVHSNERKFCEEAFQSGRGAFVSEFVDGYEQSKRGGTNWVNWKINDALSLHPNYINLLGWQGGDALLFLRERRDLIEHGLRRMGYRLVPTRVEFPAEIRAGKTFQIEMNWVNRAVGRAPGNFDAQFFLLKDEAVYAQSKTETLPTSGWIEGETYSVKCKVLFAKANPGEYTLAFKLHDPKTGRTIALPLAGEISSGTYKLGSIHVQK